MRKEFFENKEKIFESLYDIDVTSDKIKKATNKIRMFYTLGQLKQTEKHFGILISLIEKIERNIDILRLKDDAFLRGKKKDGI